MSSKRAAISDLNHDNWNDEEEGEDAGQFRKASEDELQKRVRKVAKRRNVGGDSEGAPANPFSGFGGFKSSSGLTSSTPLVGANSSPFGFLAKIPSAVSAPKTNGTSTTEKSSSQIEYLSKLKALNIAVADWIKTHVDESPLCLLTPIFQDYEKYLKEFEELKKVKSNVNQTPEKPKETEPKPAAPLSTFSFGKPSAPASPATVTPTTTNSNSVFSSFKFGGDSAASPPKASDGISFGSVSKGISFSAFPASSGLPPAPTVTETPPKENLFGVQSQTASSTFSFGLKTNSTPSAPSLFGGIPGATPSFSFGNVTGPPKADQPKESTEEDAEDEPPKNEFVPVVEDDSLYSKRCKVFVKGAADYNDRGVGTLYIKKVDESKIQMIVRADTNLGNIIFNIMIVDGLPVSRMGKNNVMVVCIPTPDAKPPPTSVLLRVKTGEDADELLETINKYKK